MSDVRSFIAIDCPLKIKDEVLKVQQELKSAIQALGGPVQKIGWVRPDGFHLTLKFLGNVPKDNLPKIADAVKGVTGSFPPFVVSIGGVGVFPNMTAPRIFWVGSKSGGDDLMRLQQGIEQVVCLLGIKKEDRSFHPHLTLGRVRTEKIGPDIFPIREAIKGWHLQNQERKCGQFEVKEVLLMKSDLMPGRAVYTPLAALGLV
jgi:2'-5' RNA ligase